MVDEKRDTLQAKAIEMVQYQDSLNACTDGGESKFCLLFFDNQLYSRLNKAGIDTDCSLPSSAQGTEKRGLRSRSVCALQALSSHFVSYRGSLQQAWMPMCLY